MVQCKTLTLITMRFSHRNFIHPIETSYMYIPCLFSVLSLVSEYQMKTYYYYTFNPITAQSNSRRMCSAPGTPQGLSLSAAISAKVEIGGTLCAHNCPDPDKSVLLSVTAGLDSFSLTGAISFLGYTAKAGFSVPLGFIGYRNA